MQKKYKYVFENCDVPHLVSLAGLYMTVKYVANWYSIVALYAGILSKTTARFKDGKEIVLSKHDYLAFREEIYRRYLEDQDFTYETYNDSTVIRTKEGLRIILLPNYSNIIDEIFVRNCYNVKDLSGRCVIDIGAFFGDSSLYFVTRGASKVYGFEIDPEFYRLAQQNVELNNLSDTICLYQKDANSTSLEALILESSLKNVFLKMDCEGCEYEIVENMNAEAFKNVTDVVMEYHKQSEPLVRRLRSLGFKVRCKKSIFPRKAEGMIFAKRS
jgi:16S rRNA G966 N2-methylase RsmD